MVPVIFLVTLMSFVLLRLSPGDPVAMFVGDAPPDPGYIERMRQDLGLDQPIPVQYVAWLGHVVRGDLGMWLTKRKPVAELSIEAAPRTLELGLVALVLHSGIALVLGTISALKRDSFLDLALTTLTLMLVSVPGFVTGFALILVFAVA